ncbi:MAG: DUF2796 domain-containing protein [Burkholderiaceae bacterium]|jgi:hypothetical protein|nr:DUF2796 domain-containing protein [Burkholderiaceae bacterium]MCZ8174461.1 DUF2796 domain-containing protein [Burkholderiaceae bacterium]
MRSLATLTLAAAAALTAPAHAHKAHVHGVMNLNLAIDGPVLVVELVTPQDSLVGHERRPRPGAETTAAAAALALLREAPRWLQPDAAAGCSAGAVTIAPGKLEGPAPPGEKEGGHADVEARVEWRCQAPAALKGVDVLLFDAFRRAERIEVQVAGGSRPAKQTLRRGQRRVGLAR